jgi:shikimate dehydrogenase
MTTSLCVVGSPISHSLSPDLHNSAYEFLGLDFQYGSFEVAAKGLAEFVTKSGMAGLSVTMPLKREAFEFADRAGADAELTKVSNTLVLSGNNWVAHNTDVFGISKALAGVSSPEQIHILGSGSTATSAVLALSRLYPSAKVSIMARNELRANQLKSFGDDLGLACDVAALDASAIQSSDLVLSFVPMGVLDSLWKEIASSPHNPRGVLFEASYSARPTRQASSWRSKSISGVQMLIWQAIAQVQLFVESQGMNLDIDQARLSQVMTSAITNR